MSKRSAKHAATAKPRKSLTEKQGANSEPTYKVGNGRPPVEHQFKPGQSGNPAGRKPLAVTLAQHVRDIGSEVIDMTTGWTRLDAMLRRLYADAMTGKAQAADILLERGWGKVMQPVEVYIWQMEYAKAIQQGTLTLPALENQFGNDGSRHVLEEVVSGGYISAEEVQSKLGVKLAENLFNQQVGIGKAE